MLFNLQKEIDCFYIILYFTTHTIEFYNFEKISSTLI